MKKVITYGTYDLLHKGHINLLRRAKELGDYLIVGVTTDNYDKERGKLNVHNNTLDRIDDVRKTGLADEIIIEEYEGQKIDDIQKYGVDIFAIGSDWRGKFDYLKEYCEVIYLERTKGISSTQLRGETKKIISIGVIGNGPTADNFIPESKYVSGVNVNGVFNTKLKTAKEFCDKNELSFYTNNFKEFISKVDAVYITSPDITHSNYIREALEEGKHVLCDNPIVLKVEDAKQLYNIADRNKLVLMEAMKTAYAPAFNQLIKVIKGGRIGTVRDVDVSFTKYTSKESSSDLTEDQPISYISDMISYPLLPIIKLFGNDYLDVHFYTWNKSKVDIFTRGIIYYKNAVASFKVGLGVKSEGDLIITGTKGYAYVPAPWWRTEYFELRYGELNSTHKYFLKFEGEGLRYEINEFLLMIKDPDRNFMKINREESVTITEIIEKYNSGQNVHSIE